MPPRPSVGRSRWLSLAALVLVGVTHSVASAQDAPPPESERLDLFGLKVSQSERFTLGGELTAAWTHDGAQAALGFEKQGRVGMAIFTVSGRVSSRVRYLVSVNPVSETASKPACGEPNYFFPNDPLLYAAEGPTVPCDVEDGLKRVDTYNTFGLDYITQQGLLREGYVDFGLGAHAAVRAGRFILPVGFAPAETGGATAKDIPRIQRLNAEANFGAMIAFSARRASGRPVFDAGLMAVLGDGNREKDYDWFYFVNTSLDTNSAITLVASARARPIEALDLRVAYKKGYTGSKVERLPSYWASKRNDDALVASVKIAPTSWARFFGEYAKYRWGPTLTSGELVGLPDLDAIEKPGYYVGAELEAPVGARVRVGGSVVREELSRDDSMVQYLEINRLYGVTMGKKDRQLLVRGFIDVARRVRIGVFWMDVSTPYPWVSGSWPVAGPVAFSGRALDRAGITVSVRTPSP